MFKKLLKKLKKLLITLLCLAVVAGAVFGIRWLNQGNSATGVMAPDTTVVIPNSELTKIEGEGLYLADETDALRLYVDLATGNIEVENKQTGYIWRSCPTEDEMALDKSNDLWKNNLRSPVVFTYTGSSSATDTKYANIYTQEATATVYKLDKGVRVYIEFGTFKVTFAYELRLEGDRLVANIPSALISDPGEVYKTSSSGKVSLDKNASCFVVDFFLFPSLGAARSDNGTEGSMLVPDGMGALMHYQSESDATSQYIAHVYGNDLALNNGFDTTLRQELDKPRVVFPAYGVLHGDNTMLAVIDQGAAQSDIVASKAGVQTGFNTVAARFVNRMKYKVVTNSATGDGYLSYTAFTVQEPRSIVYTFGQGGWVEMAGEYRRYLMDKYDLMPQEQAKAAALQLNLIGGDIESGMLGDSFITMTTFEQAGEILNQLRAAGVSQVDAVYTGWARKGESVEYPNRFPVAGALGGENGLKVLTAAHKDVRFYLRDNYALLDNSFGVSITRNTTYNVQGNPLYNGAFANAAFIQSAFDSNADKYAKLGVSGLEEEGLASVLVTDYAPSAPTSRTEMLAAQRKAVVNMANKLGSVRVAGGSDYALTNGVTLTELEGPSYLTILDESIPFYTAALHGLVDYVCGDYMAFYEPRMQLLDAVAQGGNVSFTVSWANTDQLLYADTAAYYSTTFDLWKGDIAAVWQELAPYLNATAGRAITGYETLASGVTKTCYEGGVNVIVNRTNNAWTNGTDTVEAMSFAVVKGE